MDYFPGTDVGTGFDPKQSIVGWGSGEEQNSAVQQVQSATQQFMQTFQQLVGRPPTQDEMGAFQTQALTSAINAPGDLTYGDASGLVNSFINSNYGPQIAQNQQAAQTQSLQNTQKTAQDLVNSMDQSTQNYLTSPQSQAAIQGSLNNNGMLNSGAYDSTLASLMAQGANQNQANVLQGITTPALNNIQNLSGVPYQNSLSSGNTALGNLENLNNFSIQSALGSFLANQSQPSIAQKDISMASGAANAAQGLGTGGAAIAQATWICTAMKEAGVLTSDQVKSLHDHLYRAFWSRPFKFVGYLLFGRFLVYLANKSGTNWRLWKDEFYDDVMSESDPIRAVDLYALTFWKLFANVKMNLDGRKLHAAR
jgi:hypothetical protein